MSKEWLSNRWRSEGGEGEVLRIAFPLILSSSCWTIQHFVDRVFLTWYSPQAIAAAMPSGMLLFTFISFFMGVTSYVNTFVAQYMGAGRPERVGPALWQGLYFALPAGACFLLLMPMAEWIFDRIGHTPDVRVEEVTYFRILCVGVWPTLFSSVLGCFFTGRGITWPVMWATVGVTVVHILLDYLWIFGYCGFPQMGIAGAGWASVAASSLLTLVYAALLLRPQERDRYAILRGWQFDWELFRRLMRYGMPNGVQFMLDLASFTVFVLLVGRMGTQALAATNIAFNINTLAFMPMIGVGTAVTTLVGQRLGKDRPELAERTTWSALRITIIYMGLVAAAYVLFPWIFIKPFAVGAQGSDFETIWSIAVILLRFVALYSIFDTLNIVMAAAVKGAGDTRYVMFATVILGWSVMVIPTYLVCTVAGRGLYWAWAFATVYVIALGIMFLLRFLGGKWKHMRVIEAAPTIKPAVMEVPTSEI